jgi:hypothetical protein
MNCTICAKPMYRVVNERGAAYATCSRCGQWVECAECKGHLIICPPCYAKATAPKQQGTGPAIQDSEPF